LLPEDQNEDGGSAVAHGQGASGDDLVQGQLLVSGAELRARSSAVPRDVEPGWCDAVLHGPVEKPVGDEMGGRSGQDPPVEIGLAEIL